MPVSPDYPMPWARGTQISLRVYRALQGGTPRTEAPTSWNNHVLPSLASAPFPAPVPSHALSSLLSFHFLHLPPHHCVATSSPGTSVRSPPLLSPLPRSCGLAVLPGLCTHSRPGSGAGPACILLHLPCVFPNQPPLSSPARSRKSPKVRARLGDTARLTTHTLRPNPRRAPTGRAQTSAE